MWLFVYSFIGWVYETIICSVEQKKFIKRGFLYGCYCPVYGFGAIIDILLISWIENPLVLFFSGMVLTCTLEYLTSWLLEMIFKARWWDYSYMKCHINGRICLLGAIIFGVFSVLLIKFIHPFISHLTENLPTYYLEIISTFLGTILITDFAFTIVRLSKFNQKLHEIQKYITSVKFVKNIKSHASYQENKNTKNIDDKVTYNLLKDKLKIFVSQLTKHDKKLLNSFPKFRSTAYNEAIKKIREYLNLKS